MHKKYINVFVEIDVILGLYDLKSHIKYTHNTHSQTLYAMLKKPTAQIAHLVFADTQANSEKIKTWDRLKINTADPSHF